MAKCLQISASVTTGATSAYVAWDLPGQAPFTAKKTDEFAIEYDLFVVSGGNRGWDSVAFTLHDELSAPLASPWVDQEGRSQNVVPDVDGLFDRATNVWYRRVIPVGKTGFPGNTLVENYRVGLWVTHPTGTPAFASMTYRLANVRLTNYRETLLWLWREGMATPTLNATSNTTGTSIAVADIPKPELPSYCSNAKMTPLDDISHQRRTGGRLNSWLFWDVPRDSFRLTNIILDEQQAWDLMTFYWLFRREAIIYRHRANLPAMWCRFERPPEFDEVIYAGKVRYMTSLTMLQR